MTSRLGNIFALCAIFLLGCGPSAFNVTGQEIRDAYKLYY